MRDDAFRDKVAMVTGGSSGIGRALALGLARRGARLVLASHQAADLAAVARECEALGAQAAAVPTDVTDEAQCRSLVERTVAECGRIDALFNNAGWGVYGRLEDLPDLAAFRKVIETNLMGSVSVTYYALAHLKASRGRIVATSSLAGKMGFPNATSYSASKFAVAGFFDALRVELMGSGVSVTVAYPGLVASPFHEHSHLADGTPTGKAGYRVYSRRTMTPEACAERILKAAARRRRHVLMTLSGRLGIWMNFLFPSVQDRVQAWIGREHARRLGDASRDRNAKGSPENIGHKDARR